MKKLRQLCFALLAAISLGGLIGMAGAYAKQTKASADSQQFKGKTLKVVTTSDAYKPLFNKFSKQTGAKIKFMSMSSGEVLARMKADKSAKPMADLWFGGGIDAFMQAKNDHLLAKDNSAAVKKISTKYRDPDGYWLSKGLTVGGLVVNKKVLKDKHLSMPTSWNDLTKPEYKGEIMMSDPAVSGTSYAIVEGLLDQKGNKAGWAYWKKVNNNVSFYSKRGKDPQEKVSSGEFAIGLIPVDQMAFKAAKQNDLKVIYPSDGVPWVPEGVAIFKNAPGQKVAKAFINFMLEPANMKELAKIDGKDTDQIIMPGVKGLDLGLKKSDLIKENLANFGSNRQAVLDKWAAMVGNK